MKIARVFPTKTSMSPTDPLAFFGPPTLEAIAAEPDEVHISVTFSWDFEKADELFYQVYGVKPGYTSCDFEPVRFKAKGKELNHG